MRSIGVTIKGTAPLLQHRFPEADQIEEKVKKRAGAPDYEAEADNSAYKLPDGTLYQPSTHIEGAMTKAATNFKIAGKRNKTWKDLVRSSIVVAPEAISHKTKKYVIDKRPVVVPSTRGRVIRCRPRLDDWKLEFEIQLMEEQIPIDEIKKILDYAGSYVGIGDFRPKFGRFMVTRFDMNSEKS